MRDFIAHPYQGPAIDWMVEHKRCQLFAGMGMGKTVSALTAVQRLDLTEPGPTLALGPKRVVASTWPRETKKWKHLAGMEIAPVIGSAEERRAALKRDAQVYTMNYENLPWLIELYGKRWPFRRVIADESTRLKSFRTRQGGARARALGQVAHTLVKRHIGLTGTPAPNGLADLWGPMYFVDRGERLGTSFKAYTDRWFDAEVVGDSRAAQRLTAKPNAQREIQERIRDVCLTLDPHDYFDLRKPIVSEVWVDLPSKARTVYADMEKRMYAEIEGQGVEAFNAAAKSIKCLQIASGALYLDDTATRWGEIHDEKLQALESIIEEAAGMPVLVAYHWRHDLERLKAAFPQGRELDENPRTEDDWNAGKIPVLFAHPASAGHGLNLQDGGNILVYFSHWWDLEQHQQILERIGPMRQLQSGHDRPVFIYHILARDTVDELVRLSRISKRSVQDVLLEACKRRH